MTGRGVALAVLVAAAGSRAAAADRELVVFAAASLKEAFADLAPAFEKAHPGVKVQLSLAGSQELRTQIEHGARADVFAAADLKHIAALEQKWLVGRPVVFARNEPVIVVARGNPAAIHALADLPNTKRLVVGAPEVPIGGYTARIFEAAERKLGPGFRAKVEAAVVSRELNVRQVLAKVTLGEADAGIVYRTDALATRDKVEVVAIPPDLNVIAEYPIAAVSGSKEPALAQALIALLLSAEGQRKLAAAGFLPAKPPPQVPAH
jgi:molybdate transport system substrate-binding protein